MRIPWVLWIFGIIEITTKDNGTLEFVNETVCIEFATVYLHHRDNNVINQRVRDFVCIASDEDTNNFLNKAFDPCLCDCRW